MSTARPVESRLPEILEGISAPRTPDYFDDILGQVSRTRQRPGWSFPERWLPMTALSERVATAPRIPMRMAVVLALLLLGLVVSIVLIAGSQRPAVPAPFGVAGNAYRMLTRFPISTSVLIDGIDPCLVSRRSSASAADR